MAKESYMYNNFRPTGSVIQLMDGRIFKRNQKNLWEDINTGVTITEQQLGTMISSASFSSDASGGGRTNRKNTFIPLRSATQREWADINGGHFEEVFNQNQIISDINTPIQIRLSFEQTAPTSNALYGGGSLKVYKNDIIIDTISTETRPSKPGDGNGLYTLSESFQNNDTLKFSAFTDTDINYDVMVQNKDTGLNLALSVFTVNLADLGGG